MPFNPGGVFSLVASYFAQAGATIRTEQHNPPLEDIGAALSQVLIRDGRAPMTGPLNMNGNPINNIAPGSSPGSVATLAQAMPIGAVIDFAGASAPSGWALCYGQAVSRTAYAALFSIIGTTYGVGNGSTTFNLPDLRGRVAAGRDDMGGASASRLSLSFGSNNVVLGSAAGLDYEYLTQGMLPAVAPTFTGNTDVVSVTSTSNSIAINASNSLSTNVSGGSNASYARLPEGSGAGIGSVTSNGTFQPRGSISALGSGLPHSTLQPTIIMNKIIRVSFDG